METMVDNLFSTVPGMMSRLSPEDRAIVQMVRNRMTDRARKGS
jgi:hypothetical protein